MKVKLLNTIGGSDARVGDVIEVTSQRGKELIAGKEAVSTSEPETDQPETEPTELKNPAPEGVASDNTASTRILTQSPDKPVHPVKADEEKARAESDAEEAQAKADYAKAHAKATSDAQKKADRDKS